MHYRDNRDVIEDGFKVNNVIKEKPRVIAGLFFGVKLHGLRSTIRV
jgi:hypothetical protein